MKKVPTASHAPREADALAALRQENEALAQQVKRLVRAEGKLYEYQQNLDAQLEEHKGLYELNKRLGASFDIGRIYSGTVAYVVQNLECERAVFFRRAEGAKCYRVTALEGYYEPGEKETVAQLVIAEDDPFLSPLREGREYLVCTPDSRGAELLAYRQRLLMDEYLVYPLGRHALPGELPHALLAVGNTAANAQFYRRVNEGSEMLLCMGNLAGLVSSLIENHVLYERMEQALELERMAEAKYRSIFENASEGIFQRTPSGLYLAANPALARLFGYASVEELMAQVTDIGEQLYLEGERYEEFGRRLEARGNLEGFETRVARKDGRIIWVSISARVVRDSAGQILYYEGIVEEITKRRKAEEALRESEQRYRQLSEELEQRVQEAVDELRQKDKLLILQSRQAVMGEMLSNIAHQWRQPLNMLGLLAQDLQWTQRKSTLGKEFVEDNVKRTLEILGQMSKTIDDFRYFFKPDTERVEFRVGEVIEKTRSMLEGSFEVHGIRTRFTATSDPVVVGYPGEFIQVLLNIMINARDALTGSQVRDPIISIALFMENGTTVVTIADNAGGIPEEIKDKIFAPYFTTKGPAQGTGIGLYLCKTIVEQSMKGRLLVRNASQGAEFRIEFR